MGRKWDPAVDRVGIGRTALVGNKGAGRRGAKAWGPEPLLTTIQADYCICVAATAHKMAAG